MFHWAGRQLRFTPLHGDCFSVVPVYGMKRRSVSLLSLSTDSCAGNPSGPAISRLFSAGAASSVVQARTAFPLSRIQHPGRDKPVIGLFHFHPAGLAVRKIPGYPLFTNSRTETVPSEPGPAIVRSELTVIPAAFLSILHSMLPGTGQPTLQRQKGAPILCHPCSGSSSIVSVLRHPRCSRLSRLHRYTGSDTP